MAKQRHTITEYQIIKMNRRLSREDELGNGWTASHKVHKSNRTYSRNRKEEY